MANYFTGDECPRCGKRLIKDSYTKQVWCEGTYCMYSYFDDEHKEESVMAQRGDNT